MSSHTRSLELPPFQRSMPSYCAIFQKFTKIANAMCFFEVGTFQNAGYGPFFKSSHMIMWKHHIGPFIFSKLGQPINCWFGGVLQWTWLSDPSTNVDIMDKANKKLMLEGPMSLQLKDFNVMIFPGGHTRWSMTLCSPYCWCGNKGWSKSDHCKTVRHTHWNHQRYI